MITQQVNKIIEVRKVSRNIFSKYFDEVKNAKAIYDNIMALKTSHDWNIFCEEYPAIRIQWNTLLNFIESIHFGTSLNKLLQEDIKEDGKIDYKPAGILKEVFDRIQRDYIKICVMGCWKHGKSSLLQTLTGCDDNIIPTSNEPCTGTTTTFISIPEDENEYAIIHFYTYKEMSEIIQENIKALQLKDQFKETNNKEEFLKECRNYHSKIENLQEDGKNKKILEHLKEIVREGNIEHHQSACFSFSEYLNKADERIDIKNNPKQLKKFVSYFGNPDDSGQKTHCVLGVKKVEVYFHLVIKYSENGKKKEEYIPNIQFIDTIGLGEPRVLIEEMLQEIIREDSDIAIATRMMNLQRVLDENDDTYFHDQIRTIISGRKPDKWIYYILNTIDKKIPTEDINKQRDKLYNDLANGKTSPVILDKDNMPAIDVKDSTDVIEKFLYNKILKNLETSISELDSYFLDKTKEKCKEINDTLEKIVEDFSNFKIEELSINEEKYKELEVSQIIRNIGNGFKIVKDKWIKNKDKHIALFKNNIEKITGSNKALFLFKTLLSVNDAVNDYQSRPQLYESLKQKSIQELLKGISKNGSYGRELNCFITTREKLLEQISKELIAYDNNWLQGLEKELKTDVANAIRKASKELENFFKQGLYGIIWMENLSQTLSKDYIDLGAALKSILDAQINLNENLKMIWENAKSTASMNIELDYTDRNSAAQSFFNCLEIIEEKIKEKVPESIQAILDEEEPFESFIRLIEESHKKTLSSDLESENHLAYQDLRRYLTHNFDKIIIDNKLNNILRACELWRNKLEQINTL